MQKTGRPPSLVSLAPVASAISSVRAAQLLESQKATLLRLLIDEARPYAGLCTHPLRPVAQPPALGLGPLMRRRVADDLLREESGTVFLGFWLRHREYGVLARATRRIARTRFRLIEA